MNVSVIIPTFNRAKLLNKTLKNILRQTEPAKEIIVVDDHSTDETLDMLNTEFSAEVKVYPNQGKGPGAARNTGLKYASGEFVKFFDSDDLMTLNTFSEQKKALQQTGKGFVYGPYFYATEQTEGSWKSLDNTIINYHPFSEKKNLTQWMCRGLFITIPGMLFRRELLDKVGRWREDIVAYEDWDYLWRLSLQEAYPAHTNKAAFIYRVHGTQTTLNNSNNLERDKEKLVMLDEVMRFYTDCEKIGWFDRKYLLNQVYQTMRIQPSVKNAIHYNKYFHELVWQFIRSQKKMGRLKTKTNWQPEHGPLDSKSIVCKYIENTQISTEKIT